MLRKKAVVNWKVRQRKAAGNWKAATEGSRRKLSEGRTRIGGTADEAGSNFRQRVKSFEV